VRKHLGYSHIPQHLAGTVNAFTAGVLSPYLNFHRPCHFPTGFANQKGKIRKRYRYANMMTPYDKLKSLPEASSHLKPGVTFERMDKIAHECSDNEAAKCLNPARAKRFQLINKSNLNNAPSESTPFTHAAQAHVRIGKYLWLFHR